MANKPGRLDREKSTVLAMLRLYCGHKHQTPKGLCPKCQALSDYALKRLSKCKFGENKPTCSRCPVHCYKPDLREEMKEVMRFAGPRMLLRHPLMAFRHIRDERRSAEPRSHD